MEGSLPPNAELAYKFFKEAPSEELCGVDRLWFDRDWAGRLASAGRQRVWADFDTRVLAERMRRLYETLIEEKSCTT